MAVFWTGLALADLEQAYDYIAADNPVAAGNMADVIENAAAALAGHLYMGRPGMVPGTRELIVAGTPFIVSYRVHREQVEILTVIHGARRRPGA